ncbi:MAG: hypothetical protein IPK20_01415 [Betaproteobacteria bacterium]|nr:hypothetical protein [Betaproteobacteria bacterium]
MSTRSHKLSVVSLALFALLPATASAFDVLGCSYRPPGNPNGFIDCVNKTADRRVRDAEARLNDRIDDKNEEIAKLAAQADDLRRQKDAAEARARGLDERLAAAGREAEELRAESQRLVAAARREVEQSANHARTLGEQRVLTAARDLRVDELFRCIERSGAMGQFQGDIQRLVSDSASMPRVMHQRFSAAMEPLAQARARQLEALSQGGAASLTPAAAWAELRSIAERDPLGRCLFQHMDPVASRLAQGAQALQAQVAQQQMLLFERHMKPAAERAIMKGLDIFVGRALKRIETAHLQDQTRVAALGDSGVFVRTDDKAKYELLKDVFALDVEGIASAAFLEGLLLPRMDRTSAALEQVSAEPLRDRFGFVTPQARAAARNWHTVVAPDARMTSRVQLEIALGVLRSMGDNYIDSDATTLGIPGGGVIVDAAFEGIEDVTDMVMNVSHGSSGLAPEVGAGAYSAPRQAAESGQRWGNLPVKAAAKWAVQKAAKMAWGKVMDKVSDIVRQNGEEGLQAVMDEMRARNPADASLADQLERLALMKLGASYLESLDTALARQYGGISNLVDACVPPAE